MALLINYCLPLRSLIYLVLTLTWFNGFYTPELRGKCDKEKQLARLAKQFTVERLRAAKSVVLKGIKRDKYFRLIADIYLDGVNLGDQLIKQGHTVKYKGEAKQTWC